ncbi:RHS repeat domain-containing protein [Lacinutrix sp. MEBiC02595]
MHNAEGEQTWERSLDSFGKVKRGDNNSCPFMYQGQYYDAEIELAYNRFRYYDPEDGRYISQDPIGLLSGEYNLYSYVGDTNSLLDILGLKTYRKKNGQFGKKPGRKKKKDDTHGNSVNSKKPRQHYVIKDQDGKPYHGVGDTKGKRAQQSKERLEADPNNAGKTFEIESQTNHPTSLDALKGEAQGIQNTGGAGIDNPGNYNVINSPGAPFI